VITFTKPEYPEGPLNLDGIEWSHVEKMITRLSSYPWKSSADLKKFDAWFYVELSIYGDPGLIKSDNKANKLNGIYARLSGERIKLFVSDKNVCWNFDTWRRYAKEGAKISASDTDLENDTRWLRQDNNLRPYWNRLMSVPYKKAQQMHRSQNQTVRRKVKKHFEEIKRKQK